MLHDNSILIISKDIFKVTQLLGFLLRCLKPFNFPFPIIYILPHQLLEMIESPVNILLGLNITKEEFFKKASKEKIDSKEKFIVYNIDESEFYGDINSISEINLFNNNLIKSLKYSFNHYNKTESNCIQISNNKFLLKEKQYFSRQIIVNRDNSHLINFITSINNYFKDILKIIKKNKNDIIKMK